MSFILVKVVCDAKVLRPWYGCIVPENIKIADVFDMVETGSFDCGPPISNSLREHDLLDENDDTQVPLEIKHRIDGNIAVPAMSEEQQTSMELEVEEEDDSVEIQPPLESIQDENERRDIRKNYRNFISSLQGHQLDLADPSSDALNQKLLEADQLYKPVRMTREAALDSQALVLIANIGRQKALALNTEFVRFQPVEFAEKLMTFVSGLESHDDSGITRQGWRSLGQAVQPFFRRMPAFHLMAGSFERGPVQIKKNGGARKGLHEKDQIEDKATEPKQLQDFNDMDKNEATTAEVERVHERLREIYNEYDQIPICYFEFVTNPYSFGQTIENIFHVSFLVRDGYAKISLDDDKLPVIEPIEVTENLTEKEIMQSKRQQAIVSLTIQDWKEIITNFNIKEPLIAHRPSTQKKLTETSESPVPSCSNGDTSNAKKKR